MRENANCGNIFTVTRSELNERGFQVKRNSRNSNKTSQFLDVRQAHLVTSSKVVIPIRKRQTTNYPQNYIEQIMKYKFKM